MTSTHATRRQTALRWEAEAPRDLDRRDLDRKGKAEAADRRDHVPGQSRAGRAKPAGSKTAVDLRVRGLAAPFSLDLKDRAAIIASGHAEVHQFSGGSSSSWDAVEIAGLHDGRIVVEKVKTDYSATADVVMQPDERGGFYGCTSTGEWTMSPADHRGMRELAFSAFDQETPLIRYALGHPQPLHDLAAWDGARITLKPDLMLGLDGRPQPPSRLDVTLDVSGNALGIALPDGSVRKLSHRTSQGGFANTPDGIGATSSALLDPEKGVYRLNVSTPDGVFVGEVGPLTNGVQRPPQEMTASLDTNGTVSSTRATLLTLPHGELMLRLNVTDAYRPAAIYFDAKTGKGGARDGGKATITKPDADGARTVVFRTQHGVSTKIELRPFDPVKAVAAFANKTATMEIYAPKSYASNGDPSREIELKTFTLRFGTPAPGSNIIPVSIDQMSWPTDMAMLPTEQGNFTINIGSGRLWVHPKGDGSFESIAQWSFNAALTKGTFTLAESSSSS